MSKLAIILCAVLFVSAAKASFWSDVLQAPQNKIDAVIGAAINEVRSKFEAVKEKSLEIVRQLEAAALKFRERVSDQVSSIIQKARNEVDKFAGNANGVDVTECRKLLSELNHTAFYVSSKISGCIVDKMDTGAGYIKSMKRVAEDVIDELIELKEEGHRCGDNITGIKSATQAVLCSKSVAARATWTAAKAVPSVTINLAQLSYLLTTLQPSLTYCMTRKTLVALTQQSLILIKKSKMCIRQKIDEFRDGPKVSGSPTDVIQPGTDIVLTTERVVSTTEIVQPSTQVVPTTERVVVSTTEIVQPSTEVVPTTERVVPTTEVVQPGTEVVPTTERVVPITEVVQPGNEVVPTAPTRTITPLPLEAQPLDNEIAQE